MFASIRTERGLTGLVSCLLSAPVKQSHTILRTASQKMCVVPKRKGEDLNLRMNHAKMSGQKGPGFESWQQID